MLHFFAKIFFWLARRRFLVIWITLQEIFFLFFRLFKGSVLLYVAKKHIDSLPGFVLVFHRLFWAAKPFQLLILCHLEDFLLLLGQVVDGGALLDQAVRKKAVHAFKVLQRVLLLGQHDNLLF